MRLLMCVHCAYAYFISCRNYLEHDACLHRSQRYLCIGFGCHSTSIFMYLVRMANLVTTHDQNIEQQ